MTVQILVPLGTNNWADAMIPYIEKPARPGMKVVFLLPFPGGPRHGFHTDFFLLRRADKKMNYYSWDGNPKRARRKLSFTCRVLRPKGVGVAVDVYIGSLKKAIRTHLLNGDVNLLMTRAGGLSQMQLIQPHTSTEDLHTMWVNKLRKSLFATRRSHSSYAPFLNLDWAVSVERSAQEVYRPLYASIAHGFVLLLLCLALTLLTSFFLARRVVRPLFPPQHPRNQMPAVFDPEYFPPRVRACLNAFISSFGLRPHDAPHLTWVRRRSTLWRDRIYQRLHSLGFGISLVSLVAACTPSMTTTATRTTNAAIHADVVITQAQHQRVTIVKVGQIVNVEDSPEFQWVVSYSPNILLALTPPEKMSKPGAGGWFFRVIAPGSTEIVLESMGPPCPGGTPCAPNIVRLVFPIQARA